MTTHLSFTEYLEEVQDFGLLNSLEFVSIISPLLDLTSRLHDEGKVLHLVNPEGLFYAQNQINISPTEGKPVSMGKLFIKPKQRGAIEVTKEFNQEVDTHAQSISYDNSAIGKTADDLKSQPLYFDQYRTWEEMRQHYDPITDIFSLGQIMASLAFGLDFRKEEDLKRFVDYREQLYALNHKMHPSICALIAEMTALYREDRPKNLEEVIVRLRNYQSYQPDNLVDLSTIKGIKTQDYNRQQWILSRLKSRLFDLSRRNKLLFYSAYQGGFVNLTLSSVPALLDYKNIQEKDLIFWNEGFQNKLVQKSKIDLSTYLGEDDNKYTVNQLNKIRLDANKSINEFGFSQLRLVLLFLHWYNFKENKQERISSPLILVPVSLQKKKGIRDTFELSLLDEEAEINPVLRHQLKELYGIQLPYKMDLSETGLQELYQILKPQIEGNNTGIKLDLVEKPKIQLIHSVAKKNTGLINRSLRRRTTGYWMNQYHYSYEQDNYQPLGLAIFNDKLRYYHDELEFIINEDLKPGDALAQTKVRKLYYPDSEGPINPYVWKMDACNVSLGNFNYKKMSLVSDYDQMIEQDIQDSIFDELFSPEAKTIEEVPSEQTNLENTYHILPADPTQSNAVQYANRAKNYIIQGPPGTGKSQSITNLIAQYVSQGKKVLFVCEKRAALDVVYHRLKGQGMGDLCSLIHDAQGDKKEFIKELGRIYENGITENLNIQRIEEKRASLLIQMQEELGFLSNYHHIMGAGVPPFHALFDVLIKNNNQLSAPNATELMEYPTHEEWVENEEWILEAQSVLKDFKFSPILAEYPLILLKKENYQSTHASQEIYHGIKNVAEKIDEILEELELQDMDEVANFNNHTINHLQHQSDLYFPMYQKGYIHLLNPNSAEFQTFHHDLDSWHKKRRLYEDAQNKNTHWIEKLNPEDTAIAWNSWKKVSSSIFKFLNPKYYRLKNQIKSKYDFDAHSIKPEISDVIQLLQEEYEALHQANKEKERLEQKYGFQELASGVEQLQAWQQQKDEGLKFWLEKPAALAFFEAQKGDFKFIKEELERLFMPEYAFPLSELSHKLWGALEALPSLDLMKNYLQRMEQTSPEMRKMLGQNRMKTDDFRYYTAWRSVHLGYAQHPKLAHTDGDRIKQTSKKLIQLLKQFYDCNVAYILAKNRKTFKELIHLSETSVSVLDDNKRALRKEIREARKVLENEFGKSMRFKSIRELVSGESRKIIQTLQPVWLMSPLSISDVLPIDPGLFDVIIFDEASQITVEEGVPALFRSHQCIIVGDQKQMPPTNFFSTKPDLDLENEDEEIDPDGIYLEADSLLNQGARKLQSVMLGWHYRSRRESLISFSNAAFYNHKLLTIPDRIAHPIIEKNTENILTSDFSLDDILARSISNIHLPNAYYEGRKNAHEAETIAQLTAKILKAKTGLSIGVVAFSMEQQREIEDKLEILAQEDPEFQLLYEEELQRQDDDQFNGLFVKNLENVQGDERDIMILSICYAPNKKGKMYMNFGPINRKGGEKRLNVIFSRSKKHMVVVSSIYGEQITNDYNPGANYFKKFLIYANHISNGQIALAEKVLQSLSATEEGPEEKKMSLMQQQIKQKLESMGYEVEANIGQSHFRCDLAIKKPEENEYRLGLFLDENKYYEQEHVLGVYCLQNEVLKAFGWNFIRVFKKDFIEKPQRLWERIELLIENPETEEISSETTDETEEKSTIDALLEEIRSQEEPTIPSQEEKEKEPNAEGFERYVFQDERSHKYWEVKLENHEVIIRFGRVGTQGQTMRKPFEDTERAALEMKKMISKKTEKGYKKEGDEGI